MRKSAPHPPLQGFCHPRKVISYAVWAYYRFVKSTADVEDLLAERGVIVSSETVSQSANRFGSHFAACIRHDRSAPRDKWHTDEVVRWLGWMFRIKQFRCPSVAKDRVHLDAQDDPVITAEVERLLARRTRDIRLKGEMQGLFRARIWSQTAKVIRAWMIWVAFLDMLTLALYTLMLPRAIALSMLLPGAIIPPVVAAVVLVWRKPRASWLQGATLIAAMFLILLSIALVGESAGGEFHERHLNIVLFVAITAIIMRCSPILDRPAGRFSGLRLAADGLRRSR